MPSKFLPFLEKREFFEFMLGEFAIRINIENDNVVSSQAKHLSDMAYKPLEEFLRIKPDISKEVLEQGSKLFLNPDVASAVTSSSNTLENIFSVV